MPRIITIEGALIRHNPWAPMVTRQVKNVEPRKIQKVGYSTLSVSIPMNWAKRTGIQKGDVVFISEENDGALRITPEPTKAEDSSVYVVNVDNCDNTKVLERVIVGNYVLGRNLIRVESSRRLMREQIESIRQVTQRLLGIGIIEESDRHLLLQCSIDPKNFPLETVIKRLHIITSIMFKESIDALIDKLLDLFSIFGLLRIDLGGRTYYPLNLAAEFIAILLESAHNTRSGMDDKCVDAMCLSHSHCLEDFFLGIIVCRQVVNIFQIPAVREMS